LLVCKGSSGHNQHNHPNRRRRLNWNSQGSAPPRLRNIFCALVHRRGQLFRGTPTRLMGVTMLGPAPFSWRAAEFCKRPQRQSVMGRPTSHFERGKHAVPWSRSRFGLAGTLCRQRRS
jgi:hypothetical protein